MKSKSMFDRSAALSMDRFTVQKESDHSLQRIIETLEEHKIFDPTCKQWGAGYWRKLLKNHSKKYNRSYKEMENLIGQDRPGQSYGLLKELSDVPSRYPRWGWLRNRLK